MDGWREVKCDPKAFRRWQEYFDALGSHYMGEKRRFGRSVIKMHSPFLLVGKTLAVMAEGSLL